jgi:hypothetical protein
MLQSLQGRGDAADKREALGVQPGEVTYNVSVSAGFALKE